MHIALKSYKYIGFLGLKRSEHINITARNILEVKHIAKQNSESKTRHAESKRRQKTKESTLNPDLRKQNSESIICENVEHI